MKTGSIEDLKNKLTLSCIGLGIYDEIVSLIIFGSILNKNYSSDSDTDLCIILRKSDEELLKKLNLVIQDNFSKAHPIVYLLGEIGDPNKFRTIAFGPFFVISLAQGIALIGDNYFYDLRKGLKKEIVKRSIREKLFDYLLRLRVEILGNKEPKEVIRFFKKYIPRILMNILMYNTDPQKAGDFLALSTEEIIALNKQEKILDEIKIFDDDTTEKEKMDDCYKLVVKVGLAVNNLR